MARPYSAIRHWLATQTRIAEAAEPLHPPEHEKRHWGFHMLADIGKCNNSILDGEKIKAFLAELVPAIKMQAVGPPILKRFGEGDKMGWSAVQLISTSTVTLHAVEANRTAYLDVFSCKDFDQQVVLAMVRKHFGTNEIVYEFLYRDALPRRPEIETPSKLKSPVFLMNFPLTLSAEQPNNPLMEQIQDRTIDRDKAFAQFMKLYQYVSRSALVYILPNEKGFQDEVYVANLGLYVPHRDLIVVANLKTPPRKGEDEIGMKFFRSMGYEVLHSPHYWEGEAELKFLRDNVYIGGYGIRSDPRAYEWMSKTLDMQIVAVRMTDPWFYHMDCLCLPMSDQKVLLVTSILSKEDVRRVEQVAEVIPVPEEYIYKGLTNCVRIGNKMLYALSDRDKGMFDAFAHLFAGHGLELVPFDLSEFEKSGADLGCMMMHLNYPNRV